ncbi:MAG: UDP-glucose/GDP-mannose dehydrogenase family protein [Bdellovibrionales bacterium]|nr:UDP-glucose/GDP-mannose dehydrogenase family protein [Bdellovibrionales bacterium]
MSKKVAIIGTGYVGLTTGVALSYLGCEVTCLDVDAEKVKTLKAGKCPIYEPHLAELMDLAKKNLKFTTDAKEALAKAEVIFIAVGTPSNADGTPNLTYLKSAAQSVGANIESPFVVIVNKSTVPIGSGNWVESIVRDAYRGQNQTQKSKFTVASNPEFLREGSALSDMLYADRIVVGADDPKAVEVLRDLYKPLIEQTFLAPGFLMRPEGFKSVHFLASDLQSAELIKYAANAFLALKISFINEIAELSEKVGADITHIAKGIGLDSRIGNRFLQAGIGWGGSCFGKDTAALIATGQEYGLNMPISKAAKDVNSRQRIRVVDILMNELKILKGKKIGILGLAFKPFTDDLRDAPAYEIVQKLIERGAKVVVYDPVAMERAQKEWKGLEIEYANGAMEVFQESDAVCLITEWPEFASLAFDEAASAMRNKFILDGRGLFEQAKLQKLGLKTTILGRSS